MSETAVKKEKKKWSTGKKVAVILCSVLLALILIVVSGGLIYLHNYCQVKDYTVTAMGNHDVTLIAHRGFRAVAPENTLPALRRPARPDLPAPSATPIAPRTGCGSSLTTAIPTV